MDFEIIQTPEETTVVVIDETPAEIISEGMMGPPGLKGEKGEQGIQGIPGPNSVGGFLVEFTAPISGDLLSIGNNKIVNVSAPSLTDGGNF